MVHQTQFIPTHREVRERLVALINEIAGIPRESIIDGARVDEELRMESVVFVELHVAIEDEFGIELDPLLVIELNEFGAIVEYVYRCVSG